MHSDVALGLTGVQAEYIRSLIDAEAEDIAEEIGQCEMCPGSSEKLTDLTEALEMCDFLVNKFTRAIDDGIRRNLNDLRRA